MDGEAMNGTNGTTGTTGTTFPQRLGQTDSLYVEGRGMSVGVAVGEVAPGGPGGPAGRSGTSAETPRVAHLAPDNPRAGESIGWPIRSLASRIAVLTQPRGLLSDGIAGVRLWTFPAPLFGAHNQAPFGCHNHHRLITGEVVHKKKPNSLSVPPLHVHCGHHFASPTC